MKWYILELSVRLGWGLSILGVLIIALKVTEALFSSWFLCICVSMLVAGAAAVLLDIIKEKLLLMITPHVNREDEYFERDKAWLIRLSFAVAIILLLLFG